FSDHWESVSDWALVDNPDFALEPNGDSYNAAVDQDVMDAGPPRAEGSVKPKKKRKRSRVSFGRNYTALHTLTRSVGLLGELIFGRPQTVLTASPEEHLLLASLNTGSRFVSVSLKSMGLKVQINHASLQCTNPIPCHAAMLVMLILHSNGIRGCSRALPQHIQLLPSQLIPKTCASFELLDLLHKLALTMKVLTYDLYRALEKLMDNTGIRRQRSRYKSLFRIIMQWRHLKLLRWGGRAHDPAGVTATLRLLAIRCPSCPYPGINLPDEWEEAPPSSRYLYMMFILMDANFRLQNQMVSSYSQDPGLGTGWAYVVEREPYEKYVLSQVNDQEISLCVGFQALTQANTKFSQGLRYTGVGGVFCGATSDSLFDAREVEPGASDKARVGGARGPHHTSCSSSRAKGGAGRWIRRW
ncbi:LOW QUALITY PROTEIN: hypothetical protein CVT26_001860, partial [Gymnopilus dilepis]